MNISFNLRPVEGAFGGGNSFLTNFSSSIEKLGFEISYDLQNPNLDFIFLLDPRSRHPMLQYKPSDISRYLLRNPRAIVVHRINECDQRKLTNSMNYKLKTANYIADSTVYVSEWLRDLNFLEKDKIKNSFDVVIRNGSNTNLYYPDSNSCWNGDEKLRIVTHHWSSNEMKGLSLYTALDELLVKSSWREKIEFTYIGNVSRKFDFKHTRTIRPIFGRDLARELRRHHVYITGSLNEPGGNHQNEGILSGLPIIYINSGSMHEYCEGFGIAITGSQDLASALEKMLEGYGSFRTKIPTFPHTSTNMVNNYVAHLEFLSSKRSEIVENRRILRKLKTFLRLQLPM